MNMDFFGTSTKNFNGTRGTVTYKEKKCILNAKQFPFSPQEDG